MYRKIKKYMVAVLFHPLSDIFITAGLYYIDPALGLGYGTGSLYVAYRRWKDD